MFYKNTTIKIDADSIEIYDGELIKTAALKLPDGIEYDPDFFYCKVRAVSAGEYWSCNKNFDFFPEEELKKSYKTFLNAHVFKNHENKDVANAIGDVIDATWDDTMKCVILVIRIDRRIAPTIVRNFEKGTVTDVSMGCRISHSVCSICGNKAKTKYEYCDHIKFMRGKIFNDGKKVFEINIQPKFHDISAVLNGAEKSAKIQDMILHNKVAENLEDGIAKVASFEESLGENQVEHTAKAHEAEYDLFEKKKTKKDHMQKVAELKKEIQGKIISIAKGELLADKANSIDRIAKIIKLLYTKHFDKEKCREIANQLKELATVKEIPKEAVFDQFLKVLDFAGIDLSPLEMHDIYNEVIGRKTADLRELYNGDDNVDVDNFMNNIEELQEAHHFPVNIPTMFNTIEDGVLPNLHRVNGLDENPAKRLKAVIIKVKMPTPQVNDDLVYDDIMHNIVSHLMPERSAHRKFIIRRFDNIANGVDSPNFKNVVHHMPVKMLGATHASPAMLPFILSGLMHSNYENERVAHFNSEDMDYGLTKFASYIEGANDDNFLNEFGIDKTAGRKRYTHGRAILVGIPATFAYSALQRARIHNGDNVNDLNRYIAENPANAGLIQVVVGPKLFKGVKKGVFNANESLLKKFASSESFFENIYKQASGYDDETFYEKDMFSDSDIDNALKTTYNSNQIDCLKQACFLNFMDREDLAKDVLEKSALDEHDLDEYLKIAKDSIKIEIEKCAGSIPEIGKQMVVLHSFPSSGKSALTALPGLALDSAAFIWLDKKLEGAKIKNKGVSK